MNKWRLLIADADLSILRSLEAHFIADNFDVITAHDAASALQKSQQAWPDAAIIDLMEPDLVGFEVADYLRRTVEIPVIILTAVTDEQTVIKGLEEHADDYVYKPFRYGELRARLNRLLARYYEGGLHPGERVVVDDRLTIDFGTRLAWVEGKAVSFTPIEARILFILIQHANKAVPTTTLLRRAWSLGEEGDPTSLWVRIRHLRSKIEQDPNRPQYIITERGIGYRFIRP
jgi:DNA-binding response OmpR family regulator